MRALGLLALIASGCILPDDDKPTETGVEDTDTIAGPCPVMVVGATSLSWSGVGVGVPEVESLLITNDCVGTAFLVVDAVVSGDTTFTLPEAQIAIAPGESGQLDVVFAPTDLEAQEGVLKLTPQGDFPVTVDLSGVAAFDADLDDDGYGAVDAGGDDCDDTNPDIHPGAVDECYDGVDADCAGDSDDDCDGDGVDIGEDCDDDDASVYAGATELDDGADQDCDGLVDEDFVSAGDVAIVEVMNDPANVADSTGEWLEVLNLSGRSVDLIGWEIVVNSASSTVIDESVVVASGARVLLGSSADKSRNGNITPDYVYDRSAVPLHDTADEVSLELEGSVVTSISWSPSGLVASFGKSMILDGRVGTWPDAADDGYWCVSTSLMSSGDFGTPDAENDRCAIIDLDGDGYSEAEGDCDDGDDTAYPGASEVAGDGVDNDCDGRTDEVLVTDLSATYVDGESTPTPDYIGYHDNIGFGDVDGDGTDELLLGGWYIDGYVGGVYVLPAEDYASFGGKASSYDDAMVSGAFEFNYLGAIGPRMDDVDGDGVSDLVVGGHDYYNASEGNVAVAIFSGGSGVSGALGPGDADVTISGSDGFKRATIASHLDFDGDGVAEVTYGDGYAYYGSGDPDNYKGRVAIFSDPTGSPDLDDADTLFTGVDAYDYVGDTVGGGDLDGDGYDDLVVGSWGDDDEAGAAGAYYVILGASALWSDDTIDTASDIKFLGPAKSAEMGQAVEPAVGDFDDDGELDLALSAFEAHTVLVHMSAGSRWGTQRASSADAVITSTGLPDDFGVGLVAGDFDGDGADDLAIGAPDEDTEAIASYATMPGEVYLFLGATLSGALAPSDADQTILGTTTADGFGQSLLAVDLDGDGADDLVVTAPGLASRGGRVYFITGL
jgi:hypothetical protein